MQNMPRQDGGNVATNESGDEAARKTDEAVFHDQRERDRNTLSPDDFLAKYPNKRFYSITRKSRSRVLEWMRRECPGKLALDYCCGLGGKAVQLAEHGATVHAIDLSPVELKTAQGRARDAGVADRITFQAMDAERTTFADGTFDLIVCSGVLHHLDLQRAYPELARILKADGEIICIEAMAHNPLIHWYRRRTPHLRTAWEVEHILTVGDIDHARKFFGQVSSEFYHLATIAAIPFRKTRFFGPILTALELVDSVLCRLPGVRRMAWQSIFFLRKPHRAR
jgi:ubiquinone/menaquinone biosynthesis C-methylase UbiE